MAIFKICIPLFAVSALTSGCMNERGNSQVVLAGQQQEVRFVCGCYGATSPHAYRWYRSGMDESHLLPDGPSVSHLSSGLDILLDGWKSVLTIHQPSSVHAGIYICQYDKYQQSSYYLEVVTPKCHIAKCDPDPRHNHYLLCAATISGSRQPELKVDGSYMYEDNHDRNGKTTMVRAHLKDLYLSSHDKWYCLADFYGHNIGEHTGQWPSDHHLEICRWTAKDFWSRVTTVGQEVRLDCGCLDWGNPYGYRWYKSHHDSSYRIPYGSALSHLSGTFEIVYEHGLSVLVIRHPTRDHAGKYICDENYGWFFYLEVVEPKCNIRSGSPSQSDLEISCSATIGGSWKPNLYFTGPIVMHHEEIGETKTVKGYVHGYDLEQSSWSCEASFYHGDLPDSIDPWHEPWHHDAILPICKWTTENLWNKAVLVGHQEVKFECGSYDYASNMADHQWYKSWKSSDHAIPQGRAVSHLRETFEVSRENNTLILVIRKPGVSHAGWYICHRAVYGDLSFYLEVIAPECNIETVDSDAAHRVQFYCGATSGESWRPRLKFERSMEVTIDHGSHGNKTSLTGTAFVHHLGDYKNWTCKADFDDYNLHNQYSSERWNNVSELDVCSWTTAGPSREPVITGLGSRPSIGDVIHCGDSGGVPEPKYTWKYNEADVPSDGGDLTLTSDMSEKPLTCEGRNPFGVQRKTISVPLLNNSAASSEAVISLVIVAILITLIAH